MYTHIHLTLSLSIYIYIHIYIYIYICIYAHSFCTIMKMAAGARRAAEPKATTLHQLFASMLA